MPLTIEPTACRHATSGVTASLHRVEVISQAPVQILASLSAFAWIVGGMTGLAQACLLSCTCFRLIVAYLYRKGV